MDRLAIRSLTHPHAFRAQVGDLHFVRFKIPSPHPQPRTGQPHRAISSGTSANPGFSISYVAHVIRMATTYCAARRQSRPRPDETSRIPRETRPEKLPPVYERKHMRGNLRIWLGMLSTLLFVGIGTTLLLEGATWIAALLLALGLMRGLFLIRDARGSLNDDEDS